jgi:Zn-dependent membrane protease YugP
VCYWKYEIGLLLAVGAALLTVIAVRLIALPIGYVFGRRAVRRFKMRILASQEEANKKAE